MDPREPASPLLAGRRIVLVLGCLDLGGTERQAIQAAHQLAQRHGAHAQVWGFRAPGRGAALCDRLGVAWKYLPEPWGPRGLRWPGMIWNLGRALRRQRPDILLPFTSFPNIVCGLAWRFTGARVCIWNQRDAGLNLDSRALPWAVRNTPLFLSNSQIGAQILMERFRVRHQRVRVLANAVHLDPPLADRAQWRQRLDVGGQTFVACMLANVHPPKDHATLLRAWRMVVERLAAEGRRAVLALAGKVDAGDDLHRLIGELGLQQDVRLLGEVDDVAGLLAAADLGVLSSQSEGCPNGALECMAAGLAVVGTDIPGIREAVGPQDLTLLAPVGDTAALADLILRIEGEPEARHQFGRAARARAETEFSVDRISDRLASLLDSAWRTVRWPAES